MQGSSSRNSLAAQSSSHRAPAAHGPAMSSRSSNSNSESTSITLNELDHHPHVPAASVLSPAPAKPLSASSSADLRPARLRLKDRAKDPCPVPHDPSLPRARRLIGMKERNERIFASINASLASPPRTHPPEPSLPPPPPSTASDSPGSSPPLSSSPKRSAGNLRVPGTHDIRSGLIPFAKGCSPSPRKITSSLQSLPPSDARIHNPPLSSTSLLDPESIQEDEQYGSVRHKRPERCRLIKRTSPGGTSEIDSSKSPPPPPPAHPQGGKMNPRSDRPTRHTDPRTEQCLSDPADPSTTGDATNSNRNSRTWSESISMHTSSSDTIGARDSRTKSGSRSSVVDASESRHRSHHKGASEDDSDHDDQDQDETMTTPVKVKRSESFQKTLRNTTSLSEMLHQRSNVGASIDPAHHQVARTPRVSVGRRRRSSSLKDEEISRSNRTPSKHASSSSSTKPSPTTTTRSPQSYASLSRRQRPGLPEHFVQNHSRSERADSETMIDRHDLRSSQSPRSNNRTHPVSSAGDRSRQNSDRRSYRHSDMVVPVAPDRLNGVESALSRYDSHDPYIGASRSISARNKHASWSGLNDVGGDLVRSQSVLGGVYDPYTTERRGMANRTRTTFPSPISRRTAVYHRNGVNDDDDDGQTSTTTYTNTQSMPPKAGSAGSRSRTSEWASEDRDNHLRSVRAVGSRGLGHTNSLIMSPSRCRLLTERDRTLRGTGGATAVPPPKPFAQLLRNTYQEKNTPNQMADNRSSSSGASSKLLQQSQRAMAHRNMSSSTKLSDSVTRSTRPPTRAASSAAGGLTALLSPTPNIDHHRLLISAYQALDHTPDEFSQETNDLNFALNGLLSSVVKNSCKIDATLAELNEASLNHQVEMELVDDYMDRRTDESQMHSKQDSPPSDEPITKQKYRMMKDNLAHMAKVQAQLVRSSNDQIRDLTEVLICFSKLQRSQKEFLGGARPQSSLSRVPGGDDTRDLYGYGEVQHVKDMVRSGSRASQRFSHSHSPSKLRHIIDLSPLSAISSHDESPLSRAKPSHANEPSRNSMANYSARGSVNSTNGFGQQHVRASTISFTHNRELSFDGVAYQQVRAKNRMSGMSSTSIRQMGSSFYNASSATTSSQSRRNDPHGMDAAAVDEFGLYRKAGGEPSSSFRPPADPKEGHGSQPRPDSAWGRRAETHVGHAVRGSQSSVNFPRTPPRLPTSSISQTTAHSNVSPTNPSRQSYDERSPPPPLPLPEVDPEPMLRPQSSMSKILHRAHSVLSRVDHYPVAVTLPAGRKQTQQAWDRCSRESSTGDSQASSRRPESSLVSSNHHHHSQQQQQHRSQTDSVQGEEAAAGPRTGGGARRQGGGGGHRRNGPAAAAAAVGRPGSSSATAALERLSRLGTQSRADLHESAPDRLDHLAQLRRSSTSSYVPSSGPESDRLDDDNPPRRHRPLKHHHHHPQPHHHRDSQILAAHDHRAASSRTTLDLHHRPPPPNGPPNDDVADDDDDHTTLSHSRRRRKGSIQSLFQGFKPFKSSK